MSTTRRISFPAISFPAEHNDELGGTGRPPSQARDRADTGGDSDAEDERVEAPAEYVLLSFCSSCSLLSSYSHSSSFQSSFLPQSTTMSRTGQDMTNTDGDENTRPDKRATGEYSVVFLFNLSSLLYSSSCFTLLLLH